MIKMKEIPRKNRGTKKSRFERVISMVVLSIIWITSISSAGFAESGTSSKNTGYTVTSNQQMILEAVNPTATTLWSMPYSSKSNPASKVLAQYKAGTILYGKAIVKSNLNATYAQLENGGFVYGKNVKVLVVYGVVEKMDADYKAIKDKVALWSKPSSKSKFIRYATKGEQLHITGKAFNSSGSTPWYEVNYGQYYVFSQNVSKISWAAKTIDLYADFYFKNPQNGINLLKGFVSAPINMLVEAANSTFQTTKSLIATGYNNLENRDIIQDNITLLSLTLEELSKNGVPSVDQLKKCYTPLVKKLEALPGDVYAYYASDLSAALESGDLEAIGNSFGSISTKVIISYAASEMMVKQLTQKAPIVLKGNYSNDFLSWLDDGEAVFKVYQGVENAEVTYVGLTRQELSKRLYQHNYNGKSIDELLEYAGRLTPHQARAVEEYLITKTPGLSNKIHSIALDNVHYDEAIKWAEEFAKTLK